MQYWHFGLLVCLITGIFIKFAMMTVGGYNFTQDVKNVTRWEWLAIIRGFLYCLNHWFEDRFNQCLYDLFLIFTATFWLLQIYGRSNNQEMTESWNSKLFSKEPTEKLIKINWKKSNFGNCILGIWCVPF